MRLLGENKSLMLDFFLWPMLIPLVLPLTYILIYKRKSISEISMIILIIIVMIISYWPFTNMVYTPANILQKSILFVLFPIIILYFHWRKGNQGETKYVFFNEFGILKKEIQNSLKLGLFFLPIMLLGTFLALFFMPHRIVHPNVFIGTISFLESFTEEFFFRGILFLYLWNKTNLQIAYCTSLASFVFMHPQHFTSLFMFSTVLQGILTLEICRKTKNLTGAWILHGTNRFFSIAIFPFLL